MEALKITVVDHQLQQIVCERTFERFPVKIGRGTASDLALDYPFVSSRHAEVRRHGESLRLCDLGARNALAVGARRVPAGGVVVGARLVATIGPLELRFALAGPARAPLPSRAAASGTIDELPSLPADAVHCERRARLQSLLHDLRPRHAALCRARAAWHSALATAHRSLHHDPDTAAALLAEFPAADRPASDPPAPLSALLAAADLAPGVPPPASDDDARALLAHLRDILRVLVACTLEQQRLRAEQAAALGVPWRAGDGPLAALDTVDDALRHLLDWRDDVSRRDDELVRLFAAVCDHQRALARASLEAARDVVAALAPAEIERAVTFPWPTRAAALWRQYEASHAALLGDSHDHLTPAFKDTLARAYADALARAGVPVRENMPE